MRILGLGGLDHNGSACIVEHGEVTTFLELERVTRIKNQGIDGPDALNALLARLAPGVVDHIAIADQTWYDIQAPWLTPYLDERFGAIQRSVHGHHDCHMACAFATSPYATATVLSIDGKGDGLSGAAGVGTRASGSVIDTKIPSAHSLGRLWWAASEYAGMPGHHSAGKTMALAAYGEPAYFERIKRHIRTDANGGFRLVNLDEPEELFRQVPRLVTWMSRITGIAPATSALEAAHRDMAASIQRLTEVLVEHLVKTAVSRTGCRSVCLAGGVALNGLTNQRLIERGVVDSLFVPPCTDDRGLSIGAAALASWQTGMPMRSVPGGLSPYLGPIPPVWTGNDPVFNQTRVGTEAFEEAVLRLMRGEVIACFEGRDEAGPRALGHRSILASPVFPWMRDHLNDKVKRRESFRPFGCSVLRSQVSTWFESSGDSPYMLRIVRARANHRAQISSALHVDGTSRLHTVVDQEDSQLAALLNRLARRGHPPLLINTSLNGRGEPIAHTADDAFSFARATALDGVLLDGTLYTRPGALQ